VVIQCRFEVWSNEYNILLKPILDGFADVVYGSRFGWIRIEYCFLAQYRKQILTFFF
jgi:hypothetical protein